MKTNNFKSFTMLLLIAIAFSFFTQPILANDTTGDIAGVWEMRGYGWILDIDDTTVSIYDRTTKSCLPNRQYPITMIGQGVNRKDDVLVLKIGISIYTLDKLPKLPEICGTRLSRKRKQDPLYNFDVLWNTINDHYAYFEIRGVDWKKSYDTYRNKINENTSEAELFAICYEMLDEFNDGHLDIEAPDKIMQGAAKIAKWNPKPDPDIKELYKAIYKKYIPKHNAHNFTRTVWGKINDKVGYMQVNSMSTQAHYGLSQGMSAKEATKIYAKARAASIDPIQDEVDGMHKTMQKVLSDLAGTEHIILDVRFNGGGFDKVSFTILQYFAQDSFTAFSKHARNGDSFTSTYTYEVTPASQVYKGKLYVLQSHWSASAVETMLLASLQLDNVSRIGSSSEGIFSDALEKVLPNGWEFTLSNEAYLTPDGKNYEAQGIPADIDLDYPEDEHDFFDKLTKELNTIGDQAIEYVLKKAAKE